MGGQAKPPSESDTKKKKSLFHHFHRMRHATYQAAKKTYSKVKESVSKTYGTVKKHLKKVRDRFRFKKSPKNANSKAQPDSEVDDSSSSNHATHASTELKERRDFASESRSLKGDD
uniref:AlNc14C27G2631 protein n=1 Tax=Albugo laibachii Nc14 TaxID=890382 RepID=F0W6Z8_9STRA|nr:AlNc14C27G2631 [Albugo laibachii Nc14]|eukprot:CCA16893.1 AlNc14C27G2631 [Albugo laibachii Nc14]